MMNQNFQDRASQSFPGEAGAVVGKRPRSAEEIHAWLVAKLSERLELDPDQLDPRRPLAFYGLDSSEAVVLAGELEEWLGCALSATLVWEYPSIEALAGYLAEER